MSTLRDAMSHAALGWVKPELDETLRQVRNEIEYFAEDPSDTSRMRFCAGFLHQVQGTLRMVELYAPAMVAEELELLAKAVQAGEVPDRDEACATLMRGTVLLPDYLERLQNGHRDIPIVLLPLLNEIRAARGAEGISESVLFAFDPDAGNVSEDELDHARGSLSGRNRELLDTVGSAVKEELLRIKDALDLHLRTGGEPAALQTQVDELGAVADTLGVLGLGVARGVVVQQRDALRSVVDGGQQIDEGMLLDIAGALLYVDASLDDQVAHLGAGGSGEDDPGAVETRRTIEVLAQEAIANFGAAREAFVAFIETNWDHGRLAEVPTLLGEVAGALRMLDLSEPAGYLDGVSRYIEVELIQRQRVPSGRQLDTLADAMASLEYYLEALRERRPGGEEILDITRSSLESLRYWPLPGEGSAAGATLELVDAPAASFRAAADEAPVDVPAAPEAASSDAGAGAQPSTTDAPAPAAPFPYLFKASVTPFTPPAGETAHADSDAAPAAASSMFDPVAAEDLAQVATEHYEIAPLDLGGGDLPLSDVPLSLEPMSFDPVAAEYEAHDAATTAQVASFDRNVLDTGSPHPSGMLEGIEPLSLDPVEAEMPTQVEPFEPAAAPAESPAIQAEPVTVPDYTEASAFTVEPIAVDATLDRPQLVAEVAAPEETMADESTEQTDSASLVPEVGSTGQPVFNDATAPVTAVQEGVIRKIELDDASAAFLAELDAAAAQFNPLPAPAAPAPVAAVEAPAPLEGGFEDNGEEIDQDIRDVFIEEFDEELVNLGSLLPPWRAAPSNVERLRPVRRVFHTLKGSGRLVGARTLGEFSWKIESMLNRVLDGSRPASPAVVAMVTQAYEVLPQLNAALRDGSRISADLLAMQAVADRVAAGEEAFYVPLQAAAAPVETPVEAAAAVAPPVVAGTPASVDSVLREILEAEVATHLETVRGWLQSAQAEPQPATEALLRAVHTMSGAFAMTDVPEITAVTTPAESYVKRLLAASITPDQDGVAALAAAADAIDSTLIALQAPAPLIPSFSALAQRLQLLVDALPEAKWPPLVDEMEAEDEVVADGFAAQAAADAADLTGIEDLSRFIDAAGIELPQVGSPVEEVDAAVPAPEAAGEVVQAGSVQDEPAAVDQTLAVVGDATEVAASDTGSLDVAGEGGESTAVDAPDAGIDAAEDAAQSVAEVAEEPVAPVEEAAASAAQDEGLVETAEPVAEATEADADEADIEAALVDEAGIAADAGGPDGQMADASEEEEIEAAADVIDDAALAEAEAVEGVAEPVEAVAGEPAASAEVAEDEAPGVDAGLEASADIVDAAAEETAVADAVVGGGDAAVAEGETDVVGGQADTQGDAGVADEAEAEAESSTEAEASEAEPVADADASAGEHVEAVADEPITAVDVTAAAAVVLPAVVLPAVAAASVLGEDAPLDFTDLDRELVDIFVEEGKDLLDNCDGLLSQLRESPEDRELLAGLQRDLHTLKGGARMAGINAIGDLGHAIESLLEAVAANRFDIVRDDVHLLERGFDRLHQLLTRTGNHCTVAMPHDLIEAFDARAQGRNVAIVESAEAPEAARPVEAAAVPEVASAEAAAATPAVPVVAITPLSEPVIDDVASEEEAGARAQEQVRVRADLLDRLVNHAGEVAIYRSRLEQQLGAFRGAMAELDRTNARLRDQLRRLDLETEAQIVARYQREQDQADHTFDPLELDRFSTLQQLSRALNESAADLSGLQSVLDDLSRNYDSLLQQQSRVSSELQDGLMRARMVPFDGLVPRLRRVVRQAAQDTGKQVHLTLDGTHGELDRNVLDRMVAPLEHMLRNSVAHGLETPAQRVAAGKPEEGSIAIRLRREGSEIVLEVADDGAGLDREAIRRRAEQRGLVKPGVELSERELDSLIFASGFSTSEQVSQLAGRGVGMDVVRNEVRQLGGSVEITSVRGRGVTFTLRLPQTLAVTQAVFVQIGETTFAVPVASVSGIGRISRQRFESGDGGYHYAGEHYALHDLGSLVGQDQAKAEGQEQIPLLLVRAGDLRAAVAIDQVVGNREIVVKPVGLQIASVPGIYGATITGDGRVVVILDVAPLVRRHLANPQRPAAPSAASNQRQVPMVMVVDDSLTMRKVTGRVLERHNFEVVAARDGIEALERLEERVPDLMLLDIEMPRMDGYELATAMRADPRYKDVPIVMITSRSGDKHRQRAFEIGVQRYLGKPYQELDLMRNVYDLLGIARARD